MAHIIRHFRHRLKSATARPRQDSPLFKLSPELRNQIYEYVLPTDEKVYTFVAVEARDIDSFPDPPLLKVCSQVRNEALPLYYGSTRFHIRFTWEGYHTLDALQLHSNFSRLVVFLKALGPRRVALLGRVVIGVTEKDWEKVQKWVVNPQRGSYAREALRELSRLDDFGLKATMIEYEATKFDLVDLGYHVLGWIPLGMPILTEMI